MPHAVSPRRPLLAALALPAVLAGFLALHQPGAHAAAAAQKLNLKADPHGQLKFNVRALKAKAGKVTLVMVNPKGDPVPHAIAVKGRGVKKGGKTVTGGGTSTVTVSLKKGTYTFYCPVPGHELAGMKGKLVVR